MTCLSHDCDLRPSVIHRICCANRNLFVSLSPLLALLPRNEQADGRLSISFDRNQVRRTEWLFDKDEERMGPFVPGLPKLCLFPLEQAEASQA